MRSLPFLAEGIISTGTEASRSLPRVMPQGVVSGSAEAREQRACRTHLLHRRLTSFPALPARSRAHCLSLLLSASLSELKTAYATANRSEKPETQTASDLEGRRGFSDRPGARRRGADSKGLDHNGLLPARLPNGRAEQALAVISLKQREHAFCQRASSDEKTLVLLSCPSQLSFARKRRSDT